LVSASGIGRAAGRGARVGGEPSEEEPTSNWIVTPKVCQSIGDSAGLAGTHRLGGSEPQGGKRWHEGDTSAASVSASRDLEAPHLPATQPRRPLSETAGPAGGSSSSRSFALKADLILMTCGQERTSLSRSGTLGRADGSSLGLPAELASSTGETVGALHRLKTRQ
jgi:hypothetical protein